MHLSLPKVHHSASPVVGFSGMSEKPATGEAEITKHKNVKCNVKDNGN